MHFVKGLRCFVAGRVVDEAFHGSELHLVLIISMVLKRMEGVHGLPCPCCPVVEVDRLSGQNLFAVLDCGNKKKDVNGPEIWSSTIFFILGPRVTLRFRAHNLKETPGGVRWVE